MSEAVGRADFWERCWQLGYSIARQYRLFIEIVRVHLGVCYGQSSDRAFVKGVKTLTSQRFAKLRYVLLYSRVAEFALLE